MYPKRPEPAIQSSASVLRCCGKGKPVKTNKVMFSHRNAMNMAIVLDGTAPIRLLETSAVIDDTVQITDAQIANISPNRSIYQYV